MDPDHTANDSEAQQDSVQDSAQDLVQLEASLDECAAGNDPETEKPYTNHSENASDADDTSISTMCENEEEIDPETHASHMMTIIEKFPKIKKRNETGACTEEFQERLGEIWIAYYTLQSYPVKRRRDIHKRAGALLASSGSVEIICDEVVEELEKKYYLSEDDEITESSLLVLYYSIAVLWNASDHVQEVAKKLRDHPLFLPKLLDKLKQWETPHLDGILHDDNNLMEATGPNSFISILHNVGLQDDSIPRLRQLQTIENLLPYLQSDDKKTRIVTIATLADVMTDEQAKVFSTTPEQIQIMFEELDSSLDSPSHLSTSGLWVTEILRAIRHLARDNKIKKTLVDMGILKLLTKGLALDLEGEKEACIETILVLSFLEENAKTMVEDEKLLDGVVKLYQDNKDNKDNKECRRSAEALLWQLRHGLGTKKRYQRVVQEFRDNARPSNKDAPHPTEGVKSSENASSGHVMLSYQWDNQEVVKKICAYLESHNLKVWLDINEMGGSTRQSMAEAVEKASVVLCCFSQKYKNSSNCRQELEYACDLGKPIIPLKMQVNYKPDGWLGFVLTGKLFYDFSGKYAFDTKVKSLLQATQRQLETPQNTAVDKPNASRQSDSPVNEKPSPLAASPSEGELGLDLPPIVRPMPPEVDKVKTWSQEEVKKWFHKHGVKGDSLNQFSGKDVALLYSLRHEAPEFFYRIVEAHALREMIQFGKALDSLAPAPGSNQGQQKTQSKLCTLL